MAIIKLPYEGKVRMTSKFGMRMLGGKLDSHKGWDLVGNNKYLHSPCDGKVVMSAHYTEPRYQGDRTYEWGNFICILADDGTQIFMCHMAERYVSAGERVKMGAVVGLEGSTGYSTGSHCHFEIRRNGESINPTIVTGIPNEVGEYKNTFKEDDMTREEVIAIIKEYEAAKKTESAPDWAIDELGEAVNAGITDGTRPMESSPRYQTAIMCKRVYVKLKAMIERLSADIGDLNAKK